MPPSVAMNFYEDLKALSRSPGVGHYHDGLLSRKYRFWNFYSYVVAYARETKPIQVISVVHGVRDLAAFFARGVGDDLNGAFWAGWPIYTYIGCRMVCFSMKSCLMRSKVTSSS